jgi:hypothetical protein
MVVAARWAAVSDFGERLTFPNTKFSQLSESPTSACTGNRPAIHLGYGHDISHITRQTLPVFISPREIACSMRGPISVCHVTLARAPYLRRTSAAADRMHLVASVFSVAQGNDRGHSLIKYMYTAREWQH